MHKKNLIIALSVLVAVVAGMAVVDKMPQIVSRIVLEDNLEYHNKKH